MNTPSPNKQSLDNLANHGDVIIEELKHFASVFAAVRERNNKREKNNGNQ